MNFLLEPASDVSSANAATDPPATNFFAVMDEGVLTPDEERTYASIGDAGEVTVGLQDGAPFSPDIADHTSFRFRARVRIPALTLILYPTPSWVLYYKVTAGGGRVLLEGSVEMLRNAPYQTFAFPIENDLAPAEWTGMQVQFRGELPGLPIKAWRITACEFVSADNAVGLANAAQGQGPRVEEALAPSVLGIAQGACAEVEECLLVAPRVQAVQSPLPEVEECLCL